MRKKPRAEVIARSISFSELYFISAEELDSVLELFPDEAFVMQVVARERKERALQQEEYDDEELLAQIPAKCQEQREKEAALRRARDSMKQMRKSAFSFATAEGKTAPLVYNECVFYCLFLLMSNLLPPFSPSQPLRRGRAVLEAQEPWT